MIFFRKYRRNKQPPPRWMMWLMLVFILYAVFASQNHHSPTGQAINKATKELSPNNLLDIEGFKATLFPNTDKSIMWTELQTGSGDRIVCGQEATIAYTTHTEEGSLLPDLAEKDRPLIFRLGEGRVLPALEEGVSGMAKNGIRQIRAEPSRAYGNKLFAKEGMPSDAPVVFNVTLLELSPTLPDPLDTSYRILLRRPGNGLRLLCGDSAQVKLTIWDVEGKKLYPQGKEDPPPITIKIGESRMFMGLEQALINSAPGAQYLLIVPPEMQKTMHGDAPTVAIPFPTTQTVLVDVEIIP